MNLNGSWLDLFLAGIPLGAGIFCGSLALYALAKLAMAVAEWLVDRLP